VRKIIEFDDTFPTGERTLQLVLPLRGGRLDAGRITKHASEALDYIKNVSPEPGKTHLLLLAMGAEETYGPNRNGDGFSEYPVPARGKEATARGERWWVAPGQELTQTYRTFESNPARAFRHHQNKDPDKASGYVKRAFWNPRMHRVELLTVIDNEKDAEWVERVEQGEFPAVSMGCRIKYDVCSRCGNRAPSRAEYCKHALAMNQVNPDGTKNFVYNPDSDFFDISRVFRPADRIGYTLKKVAEAGPARLAADLGSEAETAAYKMAAARKLSEMSKTIRGEPIASSTLSRGERDLAIRFRDFAGGRLSQSPELSSRVVQAAALAPGVGLRGIVTTAGRAGVVLKDAEFADAAVSQLVGRPTRVSQDTVTRLAAAADAALELFAESPTLLDRILDECKLGEASAIHAPLAAEIDGIRDKRAYVGDMLYRRLVPEGAGLRPDAGATTDLVHLGNGAVTTRGAALDAQDAVTRAHMRKVLGGTALMLGGYKMLTAYPGLRGLRAPLAVGAGALGHAALSPRPGRTVDSVEGVPVPDITETAPKMAAIVSMVECRSPVVGAIDLSRAKVGSVVDPIVGLVLDVERVVDLLGEAVIG
jgi:ribosomal protein L40E